jgi:hemerythrin
MSIAWTDDLNTGIDVIDFQHRRIVDYMNHLEAALIARDRKGIGRVLDELSDYTESHFAFEESLQAEAGYKLAVPHKATHDLFVKRLIRYQERHDEGDDIGENLYDMLTTWLLHHIKRDDAAYVADVQRHLLSKAQAEQEGQGESTSADSWLSRQVGRFFKE